MKNVIALILGGGQGKRLFPLTKYRSKPAVPIGGKYRLIDIPISNCLHSDIKNVYVATQFNSESLNNHINNTYRFDYFSRAFVRILAAEQRLESTNWFQGTADAVRRNLLHLHLRDDKEEILVLSGDHLYDMDYRELIEFHRSRDADLTVSVVPVSEDEVKELGILRLGKNERILAFKEKPSTKSELKHLRYVPKKSSSCQPLKSPSYLASMGVYVFKTSALRKALESEDLDFGREIIPHSINKFKSFGYVFNGYWKDIGTIRSFYDVNIDLALSKPHLSFFYNGRVFTRPRFLPPARILNCRIEKSLITEGCVINDAEIKRSTVGLRSIIGKGCKIEGTVLMGADYYEDPQNTDSIRMGIGDGSIIENAIIDKNARIGKNVTISNAANIADRDGNGYYIRDGIVVIPKHARIENGTKI